MQSGSTVVRMPTWRKAAMRTVGILNTVLGSVGLWWMASSARWALFRLEPQPDTPFFRIAFLVMTGINTSLIALFVTAAIQLLRLRKSGVIIHAVASATLITYSFLNGGAWLLGNGVGMSIAAATGVGNMGVAPFEFGLIVPDLYPIVTASILLLTLRGMTVPKSLQVPNS